MEKNNDDIIIRVSKRKPTHFMVDQSIFDSDLRISEKMTLIVIQCLEQIGEELTVDTIAQKACLTVQQTELAIKSLAQKGWITEEDQV